MPLRVAALRRSSREIVDGARPRRRAISRTPRPPARHSALSSRSAKVSYRRESGLDERDKWEGAIPPVSRNQRVPTGCDIPTAIAASSLERTSATSAQNRRRCSCRATGGRPGDRNLSRKARSERRRPAIAPTLTATVLRQPVASTQYTSLAFGMRCREAGVRPSTRSAGDAYDNAMAEAFFATLECELLDRRRFRSQAEARMAVFHFIEGFYNPTRRHSALGYLSPIEYEARKMLMKD